LPTASDAVDREAGMNLKFQSTRDVIVSTDAFAEATRFYGSVLGLPLTDHGESLKAFETGAFCLYVENGPRHGPVFELLVADVQAAKLQMVAAGCTVVEEDPGVPHCYVRDPFGVVFNLGRAAAS